MLRTDARGPRARSETVATHRYRIASYTATAAKNGIEVLQALRDLERLERVQAAIAKHEAGV